jgi:hypothetical protein
MGRDDPPSGSEVVVKAALFALAVVFLFALAGVSVLLLRSHPGPSAPSAQPSAHPPGTATPSVPVAGGCAAVPHRCGFPDATNTGVPAGMALKTVPAQVSSGPGWHYDPRGWVEVNGNGAVLKGLFIPHNVDIRASGVVLADDRIVNSGRSSFGVSLRHTRNVTIENCDISGQNANAGRLMSAIKDVYGDSTGTAVLRDNIWYAATGIQLGEGLIQGNYLHSPGFRRGDHVNGITANGGRTVPMTIQHNTIFVNYPQTDAISLFEDGGVQGNRTIDGNLLAGGSYTIYGGQGRRGTPFNIRITDNRISSKYFASGGHFGPVAYYDSHGRGNVWAGNIWDRSGRSIPSPGQRG